MVLRLNRLSIWIKTGNKIHQLDTNTWFSFESINVIFRTNDFKHPKIIHFHTPSTVFPPFCKQLCFIQIFRNVENFFAEIENTNFTLVYTWKLSFYRRFFFSFLSFGRHIKTYFEFKWIFAISEHFKSNKSYNLLLL